MTNQSYSHQQQSGRDRSERAKNSEERRQNEDRRNFEKRRTGATERRTLLTAVPDSEERRCRYSDRRQNMFERRCTYTRRDAPLRCRVFPIEQNLSKPFRKIPVGTRLNIYV